MQPKSCWGYSAARAMLEGHRKERTRPRYLEDGGVGGRRRPGDQRSRHRCGGDERACACGHRREGVVDLHGVPQGLSEVLLRPQRCVKTHFLGSAIDCVDASPHEKKVVKRRHPALQRSLEDHRDHYKHPRPAERGRSAISLGLSQSAALNATAAGIREPWHPNNALCIMPAKRSPAR